jgi:peptidylprolyl isomerase
LTGKAGRLPPKVDRQVWPVHCYATVGVARDLSPDTGTGAELYAVIGQPRASLTVTSPWWAAWSRASSSSPPCPARRAMASTDAADRTPILSVRLASDLPADQQPHMEYLSTESTDFARPICAHRKDDFIKVAAGADICSIPVPIRRHPAS